MKTYKYIALLAGLHQIDLRNVASSALILCLVLFDIVKRASPYVNIKQYRILLLPIYFE